MGDPRDTGRERGMNLPRGSTEGILTSNFAPGPQPVNCSSTSQRCPEQGGRKRSWSNAGPAGVWRQPDPTYWLQAGESGCSLGLSPALPCPGPHPMGMGWALPIQASAGVRVQGGHGAGAGSRRAGEEVTKKQCPLHAPLWPVAGLSKVSMDGPVPLGLGLSLHWACPAPSPSSPTGREMDWGDAEEEAPGRARTRVRTRVRRALMDDVQEGGQPAPHGARGGWSQGLHSCLEVHSSRVSRRQAQGTG